MPNDGTGEFDRIKTYFAPLAAGAPGALGLTDDAALLDIPEGQSLVVTKDTSVAGVHFVGDEPPSLIAKKTLRVNLSDLAAMGAKPIAYFLSLSLPSKVDEAWIAGFCAGLAEDQQQFGIHLMGGDSTSTPGPISISITAMGAVLKGQALRRSTARPGDAVYVSGTIGDGALGLLAAQGRLPHGPEADALLDRYQLPQPRLVLGRALVGKAHAVMDVSDGLIADLGHICTASGVGAEIQTPSIPLSAAASEMIADAPDLFPRALTGGDDYELLITGPEDAVEEARRASGTSVTKIGRIIEAQGVQALDADGSALAFESAGWQHH